VGLEAYLASPPRGEVGQLAKRARRVGRHEFAKELGRGSWGAAGGELCAPSDGVDRREIDLRNA
jgi:hypothetical protein